MNSQTTARTAGPMARLEKICAAHDELVKALIEYRKAQRQMRDKWAEGDDNVKATLWKNLHACEQLADAALAKAGA